MRSGNMRDFQTLDSVQFMTIWRGSFACSFALARGFQTSALSRLPCYLWGLPQRQEPSSSLKLNRSFACGQGSLMSVWEQGSRVVVPHKRGRRLSVTRCVRRMAQTRFSTIMTTAIIANRERWAYLHTFPYAGRFAFFCASAWVIYFPCIVLP